MHRFAQVVGQCQAKAGAAKLPGDPSAGLSKGLEYLDLSFLGDADPGIADLQVYSAGKRAQPDVHPPKPSELQRVRQQVADNLPYPSGVAQDQCREIRVYQAGQLDPGRGILGQQVGGVFH